MGSVYRKVDAGDPDQGTLAQVNMTFVGEEAHDPIMHEIDATAGVRNFHERWTPLVNGGGWYQYKLNGLNEYWKFDGFITCFDLNTLGMLWSSYFGGAGDNDAITDVTTDREGNIYITGFTNTDEYDNSSPCSWVNFENGMPNCDSEGGYHQTAFGCGSYDNFIAKFDPDFALLAFTWVGGDLNEAHETPVRFDRARITNFHTAEQQGPIVLFSHTPSGNEGPNAEPPIPMLANPLFYQQDGHHDVENDDVDATDCYVAVFSTNLAPLSASYYGGKGSDLAGAVASTGSRVYISGRTLAPVLFPLGVPWMPPEFDPYFDWSSETTTLIYDAYLAQVQYDLVSVGMDGAASPAAPAMLTVSPNPSDASVRMEVPVVPGRLAIIDAHGRQVAELAVTDRITAIDVSGLTSGIYLLRYAWEGGVRSARLVKP